MSPSAQKPDVIDVAGETVVLGFDLVGAEVENLPGRLATALQKADVQQAIKKALDDFAVARLKASTTNVSAKDAADLARAMATAGTSAVEADVLKQIKDSAHFKALDKSLKDLADTFKKTPLGAWLDKEKNILYVVAAGAVVGGVAAMYVTRKGDLLTNNLLPLLGRESHTFKPLGALQLEVGVDKITFTPSTRSASGMTFVTAKWQGISAELSVTVTKADAKVSVAADGKLVIPITPDVKATAGGSGNSANQNWSLHIGVEVDVLKNVHLGVFGGIGKGGLGTMPAGDAFKAMPPPPSDPSKPAGFVGLGISGSF